ncbi:hypothetical protein GFS31_37940 [Leptolyngbya sp. BL0902]|nr:hypothetical protein [Leptolyngbya sp. BL0902]QQE67087.1 hypothetical protein GFS31_37940 [Leptolyngbya sp. BL0902]
MDRWGECNAGGRTVRSGLNRALILRVAESHVVTTPLDVGR